MCAARKDAGLCVVLRIARKRRFVREPRNGLTISVLEILEVHEFARRLGAGRRNQRCLLGSRLRGNYSVRLKRAGRSP